MKVVDAGPDGGMIGMSVSRTWPATKRETTSHYWIWDTHGRQLANANDRPTKYSNLGQTL